MAISGEVTAAWWRSFNDPALSAIVETALANNTGIAIAATRVAAAANGYITLRGLSAQLLVLRDTLQARADEQSIANRRAETGDRSEGDGAG